MRLTFRTEPPPTYISPSHEEMKEAAEQVGLKGFARDLVADLCNLAAGGRTLPPSAYRDAVRKRVEESLPAPDPNGNWVLPKGSYTKNREELVGALADKAMRYHQNVGDFLQTVDLQKFPGNSPLEQAMSLLKLLSKQQGGFGGGEVGEPLPIFTDNDKSEGVARALHETLDLVDALEGDELDMLDPQGANHEIEEEQDGQRSGSQSLNRLKVAEDLVPGSDKRVMLDISRTLDQFTKLQARKQVKLEEDPAGEEIRQRPIRHLGELSRVPATAWATRQQNPSFFLYQAVTGQLPVRERVTRVERRQAIYILVDGSGSMNGQKHWKATGVVMNRLKAVLSGDAVVWVAVFDTTLTKAECASTPEEARVLIKKFSEGNFRGGGTDIAAAVKAAHRDIEERIQRGETLYRPEVVVLTDDDTSISALNKADIPGTRVHGFAIESVNKALVSFAQLTGGVGVEKF